MDGRGKKVLDPAGHQPSQAELEEAVSIDATPESLAWVVTRGGAWRRGAKQSSEGKSRSA